MMIVSCLLFVASWLRVAVFVCLSLRVSRFVWPGVVVCCRCSFVAIAGVDCGIIVADVG